MDGRFTIPDCPAAFSVRGRHASDRGTSSKRVPVNCTEMIGSLIWIFQMQRRPNTDAYAFIFLQLGLAAMNVRGSIKTRTKSHRIKTNDDISL